MTDVTFVFFVLASAYFLLLSEEMEGSRRYVALGGLFFGLAFMTKQLQALLIPLIIISYFFATRRGIRFFFSRHFALFWRVGLLVVSPWLIYMTLRFGPDFWQSHFLFSGVTRTISPIEGHVEGYLYYFSHLVNYENLFWVILLPLAAGLCAFNAFVRRSKGDTLILAWMTIVLAVFTLAQTKLFWYILPAFPAFAIALSSLIFQLVNRIPLLIRYLCRSIDRIVGMFKITALIRGRLLKLPIVKNIRFAIFGESKSSQRPSLISLLPPTESMEWGEPMTAPAAKPKRAHFSITLV